MPHQIIEYSKNLEDRLDIRGLVEALHMRAAEIEALPLAGLRTRAFAAEHFAIADRHHSNGYIAVYLRIGQGRTDAVKEATGMALYECLCEFTAPLFDSTPVALSYEVQEIDPRLRWNKNNLRDYIARRTGSVDE